MSITSVPVYKDRVADKTDSELRALRDYLGTPVELNDADIVGIFIVRSEQRPAEGVR